MTKNLTSSTPVFDSLLGSVIESRDVKSNEVRSVCTFEKDTAALNALAVKIVRTPSTKSQMKKKKKNIVAVADIKENGNDDQSTTTFEQDLNTNNKAKLAMMPKQEQYYGSATGAAKDAVSPLVVFMSV